MERVLERSLEVLSLNSILPSSTSSIFVVVFAPRMLSIIAVLNIFKAHTLGSLNYFNICKCENAHSNKQETVIWVYTNKFAWYWYNYTKLYMQHMGFDIMEFGLIVSNWPINKDRSVACKS